MADSRTCHYQWEEYRTDWVGGEKSEGNRISIHGGKIRILVNNSKGEGLEERI